MAIDESHQYGPISKSPGIVAQPLPEPELQSQLSTQKPNSNDEEQPLLDKTSEGNRHGLSDFQIASIIAVILLGEFLGSMDGTFITSAGPTISSMFGRLEDVNWLTTAAMLGVSFVQPSIGKLSDILGRKTVLLTSYFLFALGRVICGLSNSMDGVILGRAVGGTGGAGMVTIASIVITDLVAKRDLAMWRSYVNLVMTLGRSLGGPVGGALIDYLGWRWLFLIQVPFITIAFLLVAWKMNLPTIEDLEPGSGKSSKASYRRVDYLGSLTTGLSVVAGLILLDMGGQRFAWISPTSMILAVVTLVFGVAFFVVEAFVAAEPVFSLHLLRKKDVVLSYLIMPLQSVAQMAMMFFVPLYFQVTAHASNTVAGAHLAPAVAGNAVGSLLAGVIIHRTGRFKSLGVSAGLIGALCYLLLILRWKGHTGVLESFYIVPGGFGMGICQSVIFVAMTTAIEAKDVGMATSGLFQTMNIAVAVGLTASTSTLRMSLKSELEQRITTHDAPKIIERVMSDIGSIRKLPVGLEKIVVSCYITGLRNTYYLSLGSALLSFATSLFLTNRQL